MKKFKALFMVVAFFAAGGCGKVFAQGTPVIDIANLIQSIESLYSYYQQVQNTIEQIQNTYKQIEQAAKQVASFNPEDLKSLGDSLTGNFSGIGGNPWEQMGGYLSATRTSAQDIVNAVDRQMNKINALEDSITKESVSFGGVNVSLASLCGVNLAWSEGKISKDKVMNDKTNLVGFVKNAFDYTLDTENGPFADTIDAWEGDLTFDQKKEIMKTYGMSPRNYAALQCAEYQLDNLINDSNLYATEDGQRLLLAEIEGNEAVIAEMIKNAPEGSLLAQQQANTMAINNLGNYMGGLQNTMNRGIGVVSNYLYKSKMEKILKEKEDARMADEAARANKHAAISKEEIGE